ADRSALDDGADHVRALDAVDDESDLAVVDQDPIAGDGVLGKLLVGGRYPVVAALAGGNGDPHDFPVRPIGRTRREASEPDLRALKVGEHTAGGARRVPW